MNITLNHKTRRNSAGERMARLAVLGEVVFHADDVANLWGIKNSNTLHVTLSRYVRLGLIQRIQNGLYSLKKIADLDPYLVGVKALHTSAYVSCETVLFNGGVINQPPRDITLVSSLSKRFSILGKSFRSRQLADMFLFNDTGIETRNGVRFASIERAIADMMYFSPKKYLDALSGDSIDLKKVQEVAYKVGYNITI
jgi:predicted transcriptional regulator of viral defense system